MKVYELVQLLEDMPEDAEVRLAIQPSYPFQHDVADVVVHNAAVEPDDDEPPVVYIAEAGQHYDAPYLPGDVARELGW